MRAPAALLATCVACATCAASSGAARVVTYDAPAGASTSEDWAVAVDGKPVHVYVTPTLNGTSASYAYFDFKGEVTVTAVSARPVSRARVLPTSWRIPARVSGRAVSMSIDRPRNMTIEINGSHERVLHVFANPLDAEPLPASNSKLIYFGPGVHDMDPTILRSGQTIYIAGGAIVKPTIKPDSKKYGWGGYYHLVDAHGSSDVTVRGRGILDLSSMEWGKGRQALVLTGTTGALIEGIVIVDTPSWNISVWCARDVTIRNVKQISRKLNSDGIDIVNSQRVLVEDCFLRNNDDEICVKTKMGGTAPESKDIVVRRCVVWNERARGLGITSETRRDISNVTFTECDIIRDFSRGGDRSALAVVVGDSGTMSDIRFENIRIEHCVDALVKCLIQKDAWSSDTERGHIDGVTFENIDYTGPGAPRIFVRGFDAGHLAENIEFRNLRVRGRRVTGLADGNIETNEHARAIRVTAGRRAAARRTKEPPPRRAPQRAKPTEVGLAVFDLLLRERLAERFAGGGTSRFFSPMARADLEANAMDDRGMLSATARKSGTTFSIRWPALSLGERAALARSLASDAPGHAVSAFFAIATGDLARGRSHLGESGALAGEVLSAFDPDTLGAVGMTDRAVANRATPCAPSRSASSAPSPRGSPTRD